MSGGRGPLRARVVGVALSLAMGGSGLVATAQAPIHSTIVYTREVGDVDQVFVADFDLDGDPVGSPRQLTDGDEDAFGAKAGPGRVLFTRDVDEGGPPNVWVVDLEGGEPQPLVEGSLVDWLADGSGFVYRGEGGLHVHTFATEGSQLAGPAPMPPMFLVAIAGGPDEAVMVSLQPPDTPQGPWALQVAPLGEPEAAETLATYPGQLYSATARIGEDGGLEVVVACDAGPGARQLCVLDGDQLSVVTDSQVSKLFPSFFPDGRSLVVGAATATASLCVIVDLPSGTEVTLVGADGQPLDCQEPSVAAGGPRPQPTPTPTPPPDLSAPPPRVLPTFLLGGFDALVTAPGGQLSFRGLAETPSVSVQVRVDGDCDVDGSISCTCEGGQCDPPPLLREFTVTPGPGGAFEGSIDTAGFPEGAYLVTFSVTTPDGQGTLSIRRVIRVGSGAPPASGTNIAADALGLSQLLHGDVDGAQRGAAARVFRLTATHAVLGRDDVFADSLAGAPLADTGPLLFTPAGALDPQVRDELVRILAPASTVYLLGGEAALAPAIDQELAALGFAAQRLAGASRIETALAVADAVRSRNPDGSHVLVARAFGADGNPTSAWADAVTGGAYAAAAGIPIVLTDTASPHPATAQWFVDNPDVDGATLLGGTAALGDAVAAALPGAGRVAGTDRAATATAIAAQLWGIPPDALSAYVIVDGFREDGWGYGLASTPLSVLLDAPLLLTNGTTVPDATAAVVAGCGQDHVDLYIRGASVTPEAAAAVSDLAVGAC